MEISKMFDNYIDITTKDDKVFHIQKKRVLIHGYGSSSFYGMANIITKNNNIYVIREVYSYENNRLRYLYDEYKNAKIYETQEINKNNEEIPIMVIESFDETNTYIGSIGKIKKISSDKINKTNNKSKVLRLFRRNKTNAESDNLLNKAA